MDITREELKMLLHYDPETGVFIARETRANLIQGSVAGYLHKPSGYWLITLNYRKYKAHRLAWLYIYGVWPSEFIDHIDKNKANNSITNLRECNKSENAMNSKVRIDNTSGYKGVYWDARTSKWRAYIRKNGRMVVLGRFVNILDAVATRRKVAEQLYSEFSSDV